MLFPPHLLMDLYYFNQLLSSFNHIPSQKLTQCWSIPLLLYYFDLRFVNFGLQDSQNFLFQFVVNFKSTFSFPAVTCDEPKVKIVQYSHIYKSATSAVN